MPTAIDSAGRLVIPKSVRDAAGIHPGVPLEIQFRDGRIEFAPAPLDVIIEIQGGVSVAKATQPVPVLSADDVAATRDRLRDERG